MESSLEENAKELEKANLMQKNLNQQNLAASSSQDELKSELESVKKENDALKANFENLSKEKLNLQEQSQQAQMVNDNFLSMMYRRARNSFVMRKIFSSDSFQNMKRRV